MVANVQRPPLRRFDDEEEDAHTLLWAAITLIVLALFIYAGYASYNSPDTGYEFNADVNNAPNAPVMGPAVNAPVTNTPAVQPTGQ